MYALKKVLIGVTGTSYREGATDASLTSLGLFEMRHAVAQLASEQRTPKLIFCSTDPAHIASAHMLAIHPSVTNVIPCKRLCFGRDDWFERKRALQAELRDALRAQQNTVSYFMQMCRETRNHFDQECEEVMILTGQCWGGNFGAGSDTWQRGALYTFDIDTQTIKVVGVHSGGI